MALVFVRHAESVGNVVFQDERANMDIPNHAYPLTEKGIKQAEFAGHYLKEKFSDSERYFSQALGSDFLRSSKTLDIILEILKTSGHTPEKVIDSRLNEKWDGIFHDLTKKELEQKYMDHIHLRRRAGYWMFRAPGGENGPDVEMRARSLLHDYWDDMIQSNVLMVGHGRWFLVFQKLLHSWTVDQFLEEKKKDACANCSVFIYNGEALRKKKQPEYCLPWQGHLTEDSTELA